MLSNYQELYKKSIDLGEQQKRRQQELLDEQKLRRQQIQDEFRQVAAKSEESEEDEEEQTKNETNKVNTKRKQRKRRNKKKSTNNLQHYKLQQSEWLRHRPENLSDWLLLPCPVGKRCLVIASNGRTKVQNRSGRVTMRLRTLLPGDGYLSNAKSVLDCVYVEEQDMFYVLDGIFFGQQQLLECEASFRFFWLRSRFDEHQELSQRSKRNEKPFKLLDYYDFEDATAVAGMLQRYPLWEGNQPQLDGMLFYHKEASYTCGTTPLVCWLFAYMLPDLLGLPVSSNYAAPEDYQPSAALAYMDEFDNQLRLQRQEMLRRVKEAKNGAKTSTATEDTMAQGEEDELEEYGDLKNMLEYQRRLELGELDMDCTPAASAVEGSC